MSGSVTLRRSRRRPGAALMVPLLSAAILVLGWSVLWGVARQQAVAGLDNLLAREAAHGRVWSCPDRAVTGYPFRIALTCRDVAFAGVVDGARAEGRLAGLSAEAWLYEPSSVVVALTGPMALATADGRADFTLGWTRPQRRADARRDPGRGGRAAAAGRPRGLRPAGRSPRRPDSVGDRGGRCRRGRRLGRGRAGARRRDG